MGDPATKEKSGFDKWRDTVDRSKKDKRWNEHDLIIQATVKDYNSRLGKTSGYKDLDWRLIKAMVWTESGGPDSSAWTTRPMQIGNPGDPGLKALLSGEEGGELILTAAMAEMLAKGVGKPALNIQAGVGYLLMRAASYERINVPDATDKGSEVVVAKDDSLVKIAKKNSTTLEMLRSLNPGVDARIRPGQKLKSRRASMQKQISGWTAVNSEFAAKKYNVGDKQYKAKLEYCLQLIGS